MNCCMQMGRNWAHCSTDCSLATRNSCTYPDITIADGTGLAVKEIACSRDLQMKASLLSAEISTLVKLLRVSYSARPPMGCLPFELNCCTPTHSKERVLNIFAQGTTDSRVVGNVVSGAYYGSVIELILKLVYFNSVCSVCTTSGLSDFSSCIVW